MRPILWAILVAFTLIANAPGVLLQQGFASPSPQSQGNPSARVWVNTSSGVYHCPGTRWYGTTKRGEYMTQKQAQEKGYRPAYGKVCQ